VPKTVLVTGAAGFIGSHLVDRLLLDGWRVTAVDNFDDLYSRALKRLNVRAHLAHPSYQLVDADIRDEHALAERLSGRYDVIVHLAARAGVRASMLNPVLTTDVNVRGTQTVLEFAKGHRIGHFVYASSSCVYGINPNVPWREGHRLEPVSPYGSTTASAELMGHVYSHLYDIRFVGLRICTVYGPRQRPDQAIQKFAHNILSGERIPFHGDGGSRRDYTYIDDAIDGIVAAMRYTGSQYELINLGSASTVTLGELVTSLEDVLATPAMFELLPDQRGDVPKTWLSIDKANRLLGYSPKVSIRSGLERFVKWLVAMREAPVGGGVAEFLGRGDLPARGDLPPRDIRPFDR
jgi:UDP-glucuronate 4-epimerase